MEGVTYAALLHDLGQYPFSHTLEVLYPWHEENPTWFLKNGEIREAIEEAYSIRKFLLFLKHPIVSGDIDADRMDYLVRDAYYTGVAYGLVDLDRLIRNLRYDGEKLIIGQKGDMAAQSLLLARSMMYPTVYQHHVSRIASAMLIKAVELERIREKEVATMDEVDLIALLRGSERDEVKELVKAIDNRRLYKRVVYTNKELKNVEELKKALEDEFGHLAIFDYPPKPKFEEKNAFVEGDQRLSNVSPLVRSLVELKDTHWRWGVYAREDVREEVRQFLIDFLG
ncbi:phosphohydrolase [Thermococcus piezophilus]|uniref:phosphohydrolase n=1 Tax=Thermococcus piezophilus TaxID=1712654 RepID=UPI000B17EAA7|nr:phosphohydrolase [Thermococcus piezophilus]